MTNFFSRQGAAFRNDLQRSAGALIGIAQGFLCDGYLSDEEIKFLKSWLEQNDAIAATWPGDIIYTRVRDILADGIVTGEERSYLTEMLQQLVGGTLENLAESAHVSELALDRSASVSIPNATFCLTGDFVFATRSHCEATIERRGGLISKSVTKKVNYVVVGGLGSKEWKHGSFGTKIEKAIEYKRLGVPLLIVHEDQWAAAL
jgi:NAD-dependent DNA ligase